MLKNLFLSLSICFGACTSFANPPIKSIKSQLDTEGLVVEVHGAPHDTSHYVGVVRDKSDFFKYEFYSLLSRDPVVVGLFKSMKRHDKLRVWGEIIVEGPQKHIAVSKALFEQETKGIGEYKRESDFPADFPGDDVPFRALVHAISLEKRVLVVEYKDVVLPVRLPPDLVLEDLYRNDIVEIKAKLASHPDSPKHLKASSVVRKESIVEIHAKPIEKTGALVKFPKSDQVKFDVYAVQEILGDGLKRQYTIVNFKDSVLFESIRNKLAKFWDDADQTKVVNGRNKLINSEVVVSVKGIGNLQDKAQANPQIMVDKLDDIRLKR